MDINGTQVIPKPSDTTEEGFVTMIHRNGESRGPFVKIKDGIDAAHAWNAEIAKSNLAKIEAAAPVVIETKSESVAVQVEHPIVNPPLIEPKTSPIGEENEATAK